MVRRQVNNIVTGYVREIPPSIINNICTSQTHLPLSCNTVTGSFRPEQNPAYRQGQGISCGRRAGALFKATLPAKEVYGWQNIEF